MIAKLIVTNGEDDGNTFVIEPGQSATIGRSSRNDIQLSDVGISRVHCRITNDGQSCLIVDLNSRNGTCVNDERIRERSLDEGDIIKLGTTSIEFRSQAPDSGEEGETGVKAKEEAKSRDDDKVGEILESAIGLVESDIDELEKDVFSFDDLVGKAGLVDADPDDGEEQEEGAAKGDHEKTDPLIGKVIGGCKVVEKVFDGKMSRVYKAEQLSMDRPVAIKILSPKAAKDTTVLMRFRRGAKLEGRLNHSNIVQVYDVVDIDDISLIIMEYVDGQSLREIAASKNGHEPIDVRATLSIATQIAKALLHAHSNNIIHRNVTPDSILLAKDGTAKLADFALAKPAEDSDQIITRPDIGLGDDLYASPEQLSDAKSVDHRADIYALGAALFALFARQPPEAPDAKRADGEDQVEGPQAEGECPEIASVRKYNQAVPEFVCRIIERAMESNPDDRYQNVGDLLKDLRSAWRASATGLFQVE